MKNRKKLGKNGSFYIALCGCAAVVALVSYVGDFVKNSAEDSTEKLALEDFGELDFSADAFEDDSLSGQMPVEIEITEPEPEPAAVPEEAQTVAAEEEAEEFLPIMPASGAVLAEFSGDTPVKYKHLDDWRTHAGIDIAAAAGDDAYVCEDGVVEKIYSNNMGGCILVDHQNGYKSLYASLGEINLVNVGDRLRCGETVGRVGDAAVGDLTTGAHLHFELIYEDKPINPLELITVE